MDSDFGSPGSAVGGHSLGVGSASAHTADTAHTGIAAPSPSSPVPEPRSPSPDVGHRRSQTQRVRDLLSSIDGMVMESELEEPEQAIIHLPLLSPEDSGSSARHRSGSAGGAAAGDSGDARSVRSGRSGRSVRSVLSSTGHVGTRDVRSARASLQTPPGRYGLESDDGDKDDMRSPGRRAFFPYAEAADTEDRSSSILPPAGEDGTASSDMLLAEVDWLIAGTNAALGGDDEPTATSGLDITPDKREVSPKSGVLLEPWARAGGEEEGGEEGAKLVAGDDGDGLLQEVALGGSPDSAAASGDGDSDDGGGRSRREKEEGNAGADLKDSAALPLPLPLGTAAALSDVSLDAAPLPEAGPSDTNATEAGAAMVAPPGDMVAEATLAGARVDDTADEATPPVSVLEAAGFTELTLGPTREPGYVSSEGDDAEGMSTASAGDRDETTGFVPPPLSGAGRSSGTANGRRKEIREEEEAGGSASGVDKDESTEHIVAAMEKVEAQNVTVVVRGNGKEGIPAADLAVEAGAGAGGKVAAVLHPVIENGDGAASNGDGREKNDVDVDVPARTGGAGKEGQGVGVGRRRGSGEAKTTTAVGAVVETAVQSGARLEVEEGGKVFGTRRSEGGAGADAGAVARNLKPVVAEGARRKAAVVVASDGDEEDGGFVARGNGNVGEVPRRSVDSEEMHSADHGTRVALGGVGSRDGGGLGSAAALSLLSATEATRPVVGVPVNGNGRGLGGGEEGGGGLISVVDGARVDHDAFEDVEL